MDDLLSEFLTETTENLSVLDLELVKLEQNPNEPALLSNIFRLVHTIKGTCGFLGLPRLEKVAHAAENVLGKFRDGELLVTAQAVTLILESLDRIKSIMAALEATEKEPEGHDAELILKLNKWAVGEVVDEAPAAAAAPAPAAAKPAPEPDIDDFVPVRAPGVAAPVPAAAAPVPVPVAAPVSTEVAVAVRPVPAVAHAHEEPAHADPGDAGRPLEAAKDSAVAGQSIRVSVDVLETLMTMVSELVLTRNQLMQILRSQKDSEFTAPLQRLSHVTTELQEGVMKTRMQPIGNAWGKLPRLVRDLSLELGKKIELRMIGQDTELDRQVLELIKDPLTHMVRNSADHGVEGIAERVAAGKPEAGTITLNAYHEGGHIIMEITDDGRGLNIDKIKEKALKNGIVTEAELASMSDQQIHMFIFKAGFSTAAAVTSVSGRGVGMDVVRTNIEKIGGVIELRTALGRGSTFIIKIPLTLAIVSALVVECGGERFAIPQISVVELVRAAANSEYRIEVLHDAPVLRLRDRLLPLVSLRELLRLGVREQHDNGEAFIVVTRVGSYSFGIIVDRVFDTEEIVVKPVAPILRDINMFSGNTILGDGSVIMILDPNGIAGATGEATSNETEAAEQAQTVGTRQQLLTTLLLFRAVEAGPKAVPLALVARLEEIDLAQVERLHGKPVVQYRGKLMPLVTIDGNNNLASSGRQPVLVFADRDRTMGLVADEILDIVEERLDVELATDQPGLLGSAIIAGKATDVIDAAHFLTMAFDDWFANQPDTSNGSDKNKRILLVDDSPFFRNLLTPLLSIAGYDVTTVESGVQALNLCEKGIDFDVIVSDIEMPGMSGFELAEAIRSSERWQDKPLVALSAHASAKDLERGRRVGFTDYVAKSDRDALLNALSTLHL